MIHEVRALVVDMCAVHFEILVITSSTSQYSNKYGYSSLYSKNTVLLKFFYDYVLMKLGKFVPCVVKQIISISSVLFCLYLNNESDAYLGI